MNRLITISLIISCQTSIVQAQDTLETSYPGTNQRWIKRFDDGKKIDETIFHENEQVWMQVQYEDNVEKWDWYYDNGQPYFKATIINNSLQGLYQIGYWNGQLAEQISFKDHIENGKAKFYYPNGQLAMKGTYRDGEMLNDWSFFTSKGLPASGTWEWPFAADSSRLRMNGPLHEGKMVGSWKYTSVSNLGTNKEKSFRKVLE